MELPRSRLGIVDFIDIHKGKLNGVILYITPIGSGNYNISLLSSIQVFMLRNFSPFFINKSKCPIVLSNSAYDSFFILHISSEIAATKFFSFF